MKKFCTVIAALAVLVSCQKSPTEEEKKAEIDRQVQERLAAEHLTQEQQRLAQQKADLDAREKALADQQAAAAIPTATVAETTSVETEPVQRNSDASERSERRSTASYGTFYRKLAPYGAWRETSTYGYVWQPREAEESRSWRPYTEGRWVYTDAGWTWVSDESFGWATYHYGRWVRLRRVGWVWVPGEEWAPAWVSWRTSKDYVGWAPLPPEARFDRRHGIRNWADNYYDISPDHYTFVPGNEFGSRRIQTSVVPVERNVTIVIETTNVTNITYNNTMVVNEGPNYEEMRSRSRQPIERYRIQRQTEMNGDTAKSVVRGDVLEVPAPAIGAVSGVDRPQTVKESLPQTTVEKTWSTETDHAAAERARAKMKTEATPPPNAPSRTFVRPDGASAASTPAITATAAAASATPIPAATTAATSATPLPTATIAATRATPVPRATATAASATPVPTATATVRAARATPSPTATTPVTSATPVPTATAAISAKPIATPTPSIVASPAATPRRPLVTPPPPRPLPSETVMPESSVVATPTSSTPPAMSAPLGPRPNAAGPPQSAAQAAEARRKVEEKQRWQTPQGPKPSPAVADDAPAPAPSISGTIPRHSPRPRPSATAPSEAAAPPLPLYKPSAPSVAPAGSPPAAMSATSPQTTSSAKPNDKKPKRPGREQPTPTPGASASPN